MFEVLALLDGKWGPKANGPDAKIGRIVGPP